MINKGRPSKNTSSSHRMIKIYADSDEQYKRWVNFAKEHNTPNSRFVREILESYIAGDFTTKKTQDYERQIIELINNNKILAVENSKLQETINRMEQNLRVTEEEIRTIKYGSFLDKEYEGERELNVELINLFKNKKRLREEDISALLHINPSDSRENEIILNQLNILLDYGLIIRHRGGYEWKK